MRNILGDFIEKRPWFIVLLIIILTIGFSVFIPSLQFKTDFKDFAPNNELVKANNRIAQYFGMDHDIVFLIVTKQQTESTITPQAIRDQANLQRDLLTLPKVNSTVSVTTFLDSVCQFEFNKTIENCTDSQLQDAIHDLFVPTPSGEQQLFSRNTTTTQIIDTAKGKSSPSTQITGCSLANNETMYTFSIHVASLSDLSSPIKPTIQKTHLMEWYLGFENLLAPPEYNIHYQLAARIEPTSPAWVIGNGLLDNLRQFFRLARSHSLLSSYKADAYLWLQAPGQSLSIPILLQKANVTFETQTNTIAITVPKKDLATYGIAPQYGSFQVPAKLSNFTAGVRYYQTPILHRPGDRIAINTSYLFHRLERLQTRPLLGKMTIRLLQKNGVSWSDIQNMSTMATTSNMLPNTLHPSDLQNLWTTMNQIHSTGASHTIYPILPALFDDLRINALSFVSKDYAQAGQPTKSIILLQLEPASSTEATAQIDNTIISRVNALSSSMPSISVQVTGESLISAQINESTLSANQVIIPMIVVIIMIILFIAYRKPSYVLLSILVFLFSTVWVLGTMALLGVPFSIIAVAIIPLLIGLGVEYSVVFFYNYRNEWEKGKTSIDALKQTISDVGIAIFLAWLAMFIAFISFLTATVPPVRDFGFLLALGVSYSFVLTLTLTVSLRYIIDKKKTAAPQKQTRVFSLKHVMTRMSGIIIRHEKTIFFLVAVISIIMAVGASQLKTGFSMDQFIPKNNQALQLLNDLSTNFPFSSQEQEYILVEGDVGTTTALQGIAQTQENLKNDTYIARKTDGSIKVESIYTYMQQALQGNATLFDVYHVSTATDIPATNTDVQQFYEYLYTSDQYGQQVKGVLYKGPQGYTATMIRIYINSSAGGSGEKQFKILKNELNGDLVSYGNATAVVTGNFLISLTIINSLTDSQIVSTGVCFLLATIILILIYRNPILGLITMIPVSISILWILGTMYYIGYTLNVLTITVTSITIGVGVDYGIYITQRFRLVARNTGDPRQALQETIALTGSSVFIAAIGSMVGFAVLLFAPIPPQQQFGLITAITLSYSFLISIFVLPLVLVRWASWRKRRKGYIVHPGPPKGYPPENTVHEYTGEQ
jgi:hydrophobe/amphiphile efflux-3 (HAE3) family protein